MSEMQFMVSRSGLSANRLVLSLRIFCSVAIRDPEFPLAHPGAVHNNATDLQIQSIWVVVPVPNWRFEPVGPYHKNSDSLLQMEDRSIKADDAPDFQNQRRLLRIASLIRVQAGLHASSPSYVDIADNIPRFQSGHK